MSGQLPETATGYVLSAKRIIFFYSWYFRLISSASHTLIDLSNNSRSEFLIFVRFSEKNVNELVSIGVLIWNAYYLILQIKHIHIKPC